MEAAYREEMKSAYREEMSDEQFSYEDVDDKVARLTALADYTYGEDFVARMYPEYRASKARVTGLSESDLFDDATNIQQDAYREGFRAGDIVSQEEGIARNEGKSTGFIKGYPYAMEIGYMEAQCDIKMTRDMHNFTFTNVRSNAKMPTNPIPLNYPIHWGFPPLEQIEDSVLLPLGYGYGSSSLIPWITENAQEDVRVAQAKEAMLNTGKNTAKPFDFMNKKAKKVGSTTTTTTTKDASNGSHSKPTASSKTGIPVPTGSIDNNIGRSNIEELFPATGDPLNSNIKKAFPDHWELPSTQLLEQEDAAQSDANALVYLPGGFGKGTKLLKRWISSKMEEDARVKLKRDEILRKEEEGKEKMAAKEALASVGVVADEEEEESDDELTLEEKQELESLEIIRKIRAMKEGKDISEIPLNAPPRDPNRKKNKDKKKSVRGSLPANGKQVYTYKMGDPDVNETMNLGKMPQTKMRHTTNNTNSGNSSFDSSEEQGVLYGRRADLLRPDLLLSADLGSIEDLEGPDPPLTQQIIDDNNGFLPGMPQKAFTVEEWVDACMAPEGSKESYLPGEATSNLTKNERRKYDICKRIRDLPQFNAVDVNFDDTVSTLRAMYKHVTGTTGSFARNGGFLDKNNKKSMEW